MILWAKTQNVAENSPENNENNEKRREVPEKGQKVSGEKMKKGKRKFLRKISAQYWRELHIFAPNS